MEASWHRETKGIPICVRLQKLKTAAVNDPRKHRRILQTSTINLTGNEWPRVSKCSTNQSFY